MTGPPIFPWRAPLAGWPDRWRERWGALANALAADGVPFPDDESRAFDQVDAEKFAAEHGEPTAIAVAPKVRRPASRVPALPLFERKAS